MENWCYDRPTLYSFAKHYESGSPLPEELFSRLKEAKTYRAGTMMLRQVRRTHRGRGGGGGREIITGRPHFEP
jgi:Zn-dependent oligopeptidase